MQGGGGSNGVDLGGRQRLRLHGADGLHVLVLTSGQQMQWEGYLGIRAHWLAGRHRSPWLHCAPVASPSNLCVAAVKGGECSSHASPRPYKPHMPMPKHKHLRVCRVGAAFALFCALGRLSRSAAARGTARAALSASAHIYSVVTRCCPCPLTRGAGSRGGVVGTLLNQILFF